MGNAFLFLGCNYIANYHGTCSTYKIGEFKVLFYDQMTQRLIQISPLLFAPKAAPLPCCCGVLLFSSQKYLNGLFHMGLVVIHSYKGGRGVFSDVGSFNIIITIIFHIHSP